MRINNMKRTLFEYEIMPSVVKVGVETSVEINAFGIDAAFEKGHEYIIRFIPQERIITAITLRIGDDEGYDEVTAVCENGKTLKFDYAFKYEGIYTVRILKEPGDRSKMVADLRIFSADEDLWSRIPMRGNTHCHASPSVDGHEDPAMAASAYRKAGFDYLAITDHHKIDGSLISIDSFKDIPNGFALYKGEEVHVPNAYIHAVNVGADFDGMGLDAWYHAHKEESDAEVEEISRCLSDLPDGVEPMDLAWRIWIADKIHSKGGLAIIAHPFWEYDAHNTRNAMFEYLAKHKIFDAVEICAGQEFGSMECNMQVAFWNDMRAKGIFIPIVGCDDAHRRYYNWDYDCSFNKVYTVVYSKSKDFEDWKAAVKEGNTVAVDDYDEVTPFVNGTYRLVRYTIFLLERYFPIHDELCFEEGRLMNEAYLGDKDSLEMLKLIHNRIDKFNDRFFGRK